MSLDSIRRFAEEPDYELPEPWLPGRRIITPQFTLGMSPTPTMSVISRVRTTREGLDATLAEVRRILREHGYVACGWYVGPSCRPVELVDLLRERGFTPASQPPFEPHFTAMMMTSEPQATPPSEGIEARLVRDRDEYARAMRAGLTAAGESEEAIADFIAGGAAGWDHESGVARMTHIAFADGEVAGLGMLTYGPSAFLLGGGAVLPAFRGRGVYRALVSARWKTAVAAGKPALTVHAGAMSRPILERCGFEKVCGVEVLLDPDL
jgi:GNAT superfamily N-acetyltransferase